MEVLVKGMKIKFKDDEFTVLERKYQKGKCKFYLFDVKKKVYLSSLYPDDGGYLFDDREYWYRLTIEENGSYRIERIGKKVG